MSYTDFDAKDFETNDFEANLREGLILFNRAFTRLFEILDEIR